MRVPLSSEYSDPAGGGDRPIEGRSKIPCMDASFFDGLTPTEKSDRSIEWRIPNETNDILGPRRPIYNKPLVLDDGKEIDRNAPGPFKR
jgi:hypothetical protein